MTPQQQAAIAAAVDHLTSAIVAAVSIPTADPDAPDRLYSIPDACDALTRRAGRSVDGMTDDASVSWRTLADIDDSPPAELLLGWLEDGPNAFIAAPGVGKGTTGSYLVVEAQQAGLRPMIYDAERRPKEWARRVSGLGGDRSEVIYTAPEDLPTKLRGLPLLDVAPALGVVAAESGADLLIIARSCPRSAWARNGCAAMPRRRSCTSRHSTPWASHR